MCYDCEFIDNDKPSSEHKQFVIHPITVVTNVKKTDDLKFGDRPALVSVTKHLRLKADKPAATQSTAKLSNSEPRTLGGL